MTLWLFSCIYASTYREFCNILWKNFRTIKDNFSGFWLLGGDFNEILCLVDKKRGKPINKACANEFWKIVNYYELIDMRFKGNNYMWVEKCFKNKSLIIHEILDLFFANKTWLHNFPDAQVHHLPRTHSDHCTLLLTLLPKHNLKYDKLFKFEAMWASHQDL